jgi:hypothetical protein
MGLYKNVTSDVEMRKEAFKLEKEAERTALNELRAEAFSLVTSDAAFFGKFLDAQALNPTLSAGNIALAVLQSGDKDVGHLATYGKWKAIGNAIKAEERENGIKVFVPRPYEKDGETHTGFEVEMLYDIAQTDGKARPRQTLLKNENDYLKAGKALMFLTRARVQETERPSSYDTENRTILINGNQSPENEFRDLVQGVVIENILRFHPHQKERTPTVDARRIDANLSQITSVAYMICKRFGLDAPLPDTKEAVKQYSGLETDACASELNRLTRTFQKISDQIEREVAPPEQEKNAASKERKKELAR